MASLHDLLSLLFYPARSADGEPSQLAWLAFLPSEKCGWVTCYFGKHDRIVVGAMILPKIPKIGFHNTNSYSLGVALR